MPKCPLSYLCFLLTAAGALQANGANAGCRDLLDKDANPGIVSFGGMTEKTPWQLMANLMLKHVPKPQAGDARQIQVAFPVALEKNDQQPQQFGDGQQNALAHLGSRKTPPFVAVLTRPDSKASTLGLTLILASDLTANTPISTVEFSALGTVSKLTATLDGTFHVELDGRALKWDQFSGAESVFFRPVGWRDWFSLSFPQTYLPIQDLMQSMRADLRTLPTGQSVIDPLMLKGSDDPIRELRQQTEAEKMGFQVNRTERSTRVHGLYLPSNGAAPVLTATDGVWTRYRLGEPFKLVYLVKDPRVVDIEEEEGTVSGTGPHYIGATAEIILNSLGQEPLMTFFGLTSPQKGPDGAGIAWGSELGSQWIGTWLKPGEAFVTPQGNYHWHLNHLPGRPVGAQVWTPPVVPSAERPYGFPR